MTGMDSLIIPIDFVWEKSIASLRSIHLLDHLFEVDVVLGI
jgi:hypothetical protein